MNLRVNPTRLLLLGRRARYKLLIDLSELLRAFLDLNVCPLLPPGDLLPCFKF